MGDILSKVLTTILTVVIAVGVSGAIWVGANLIFNQVRRDWARFNTLVYGIVGFIAGAIVSGNRLVTGSPGEGLGDDNVILRFLTWVWFPALVAALAAAIGFARSTSDDVRYRVLITGGGFSAIGLLTGLLMREEVRPEIDVVALVGWTALGAGIGAGIGVLRKHPPVNGTLIGASLGWLIGAFNAPDLGGGSVAWSGIAAAIGVGTLGVRIGITPNADIQRRGRIDQRSRAFIFLAPALLFITATLVVPTLRTMYLSFYDDNSEEFVGLENYGATFTDPVSWDLSGWANMFVSWPMAIAIVLLVIFMVTAYYNRRQTGRVVELGSTSMFPLIAGLLFLAFAVFTALRGTIINNLWWVVVVTSFSTATGLAVAVLADNARGERIAKSIIFMPMAVSLVGASIIWRFMYVARDSTKQQTGVINALWVGLGNLSTGSGIWTFLFGAVLTIIFVGVVAFVGQLLTRRRWGRAVAPGIVALLMGVFLLRYWAIIGGGIGGQTTNAAGEVVGNPVNFVQESPYNNFWLMVVLIWIQTGFSMVILSAAIKAVPDELIEAARVDGAVPSQIFWRVTLPQIAPTIGVVVTTLIVLVMKVYDIVKVMTNGNFGTQVLANDMFQQAFQFNRIGRGASLAVLLFISVLPVMIYNIRRMQREA